MPEPLWQPRSDRAARLLGLGFIGGGAALLYWQIGATLDQARAGATRVEYSFTLIVFGVMWAGLGLWWLVRGLAGYTWIRAAQRDRRSLTIIVIVIVAVALVARWLLSYKLGTFGFTE